MVEQFPLENVIAIGAGVPGQCDVEKGIILDMSNVHVYNINFRKILEDPSVLKTGLSAFFCSGFSNGADIFWAFCNNDVEKKESNSSGNSEMICKCIVELWIIKWFYLLSRFSASKKRLYR